ncbi:hypothetical protein N7492_003945 [Penicillium capsulatum]|uniref:NADP-dependent oxidoreductase domain-containing protein n=1 Tax=Penicillium capsulatum TaxID=69766 RepID=A0A9W9IPL5_9EURO|nr:hypothetical protein N7492_003945 [Penicillium capsulatum]KAJ6121477.1 hypothetical protein N7512_003942 [Penicillium capsulatum]
MGLVTYHPEIVEPSTIIDQTTLYLTTKSLFTQVQSSFPGSRALIQAGVIIASYEYATQRTNEAFASIGICARMGYAAGLDIGSRTEGSDHDSQAEEASTWWGIVIAERTIFCEVHAAHQPLISTFPPRDIALPNEPLSTEWDSATFTNIASRMCGPLLDDRDGLARVIQAAWLLDRVFTACQERDLDVRLARLKRLDHALRGYLALTMDQANGRWGLFCTANAMIFRALFILHGNVIYGTTGVARSSSYVAVETIIQMVQDIAATQHNMSLVDLDTLPPSRAFVFQAALQYLDELGAEGDRLDIVRTQITASLRMFGERWKAAPLITWPHLSSLGIWTEENISDLISRLDAAHIKRYDTAQLYPIPSPGSSERLLGSIRQLDYTIDTKIRFRSEALRKENMEESLRNSLENIGITKVNVLYAHTPDKTTPLADQAAR